MTSSNVVAGGQQPTRHHKLFRLFSGAAVGCIAFALVFASGYLIGANERSQQATTAAVKLNERAAEAVEPLPGPDKEQPKLEEPKRKNRQKSGREPNKPELRVVTVEEGDSLWGIATSVAPRADPQVMVTRIVELNSLEESAGLEIGQRLTVPTTTQAARHDPNKDQDERPGSGVTPAPTTGVAQPVSVSIPRLELRRDLVELNVVGGTLQVPTAYRDVGWWRDGPSPGAPGSAVLVGHVDTPTGPAVFYRLSSIQIGDEVTVRRADGTKAEFRVSDATLYPRASFPSSTVYRQAGRPTLTLVTCGGTYDTAAGQYTDNLVVTAHLDNGKNR